MNLKQFLDSILAVEPETTVDIPESKARALYAAVMQGYPRPTKVELVGTLKELTARNIVIVEG